MSCLITVIGNCGSGKTALTKRLSEHYRLVSLLEQHTERPFQARFQSELKTFALANQIDYLLFRGEQERSLRESNNVGIADGGLDQDYFIFTRLFHRKGFLDDREYASCERLYRTLRHTLPPPGLIVRLTAPLDVLIKRRAARTRALDIVTGDDLPIIGDLMAEWMAGNTVPTITFDTSRDDPDYLSTIAPLLTQLDPILSIPSP